MSNCVNTFIHLVSSQRKVVSYSRHLAAINVALPFASKMRLTNFTHGLNIKKDQVIISYLEKDLNPVIQEFKDMTSIPDNADDWENAPIWLMWWTGESDAPEIVKQCVKSVRKNAGQHPVHFLTKDNIADYLDIPQFIEDKMRCRKMNLANFSDWVRFKLLETYGGLWLDVTIYCSSKIPDEVFQSPIYTGKLPLKKGDWVSDYQWTSFFFAGHRGNILFSFFTKCFELFWMRHDVAIDYLFVDYVIYLASKWNPYIREELGLVPITNVHRFELQNAMRRGAGASEFADCIFDDTWLNKLSWHEGYEKYHSDGRQTAYEYFLQMNI